MLNLYFQSEVMKLVLFYTSLFLLSCSSAKLASKNEPSNSNNTQLSEKKPVIETKNTISNRIKTLKKDELKPGRTEEIRMEKKQQVLENGESNTRTE